MQSLISIKLFCNFIDITLRQGCSCVNLLYSFKTPFPRNNSGGLLLNSLKLFSFFEKCTHYIFFDIISPRVDILKL